jgi:hypothetical protein
MARSLAVAVVVAVVVSACSSSSEELDALRSQVADLEAQVFATSVTTTRAPTTTSVTTTRAPTTTEAWPAPVPYEPGLESFLMDRYGALGWLMVATCVGAAQEFTLSVVEWAKVAAEATTPEGFRTAFREVGEWADDLSEETIPWKATGCEGLMPDLYRGFTSEVRAWISECVETGAFAAIVTPGALCQNPAQAFELGITENLFISMALRLRAANDWIEAEEESGSYGM